MLEALEAEGLALGGEQSGHIVFRQLATTGDGILTGLLLADLVVRGPAARWPSSATGLVERVPQVLVNVAVADPGRLAAAERGLGGRWPRSRPSSADGGRVLLRASGTEPVVRVMVEAPAPSEAGGRGRPSGCAGP